MQCESRGPADSPSFTAYGVPLVERGQSRGGQAVMGGQPDLGTVGAEDHRVEAVAYAGGVPGDRVEHALEVGRRSSHGTQDLGRGCLLVSGLPERQFRRRRSPGRPRVSGAEEQSDGDGEGQAEGEEDGDACDRVRPAALRQKGDGQRRADEERARPHASPGTRSGKSGGRRGTPPHGARARSALSPLRSSSVAGLRHASRSEGPQSRAIIAPSHTGRCRDGKPPDRSARP